VPQGNGTTDPDEAAAAALKPGQATPEPEGPSYEPDPALDRTLSRPELNALKDLLGGRVDPDDEQSAATEEARQKLYGMVARFNAEHHAGFRRLSDLTVRVDRWIRAQVGEPPAEDDVIPPTGEEYARMEPVGPPAGPEATDDSEPAAGADQAGQAAAPEDGQQGMRL
jgi:hypothetical protein